MKRLITFLAALWLTAAAFAQSDRQGDSPFTNEEERILDEAWPEIRKAADFDDIDWRSFGLRRAPGDPEARAIMTQHWGTLREASDFDDIDWDAMRSRVRDRDR